MSEFKQGYKQTRVGIIPEDREVGGLSIIANVEMGQSPLGDTYNTERIGVGLINGPTEFTVRYPIKKQWTSKPTKLCKKGDILICVRGSSTGRINISNDEYCIGRGVAAISNKKQKGNIDFIEQILNILSEKILKLTSGSTFPNIDKKTLNEFSIPLPPLKEQEKIAQILTTWDEAITKQTELLRAKELLKIALMQKLLSGEVRFNGFNDEWEEVRLGEICKITTGKLNANAMVENGQYTFFTCARETYRIDDFAFDTEALLVSGNGANVGYIHYFNGKFNAYQRTYVLDDFEHDIFLIKYLLDKYLSLQISREKNEGNTPYITLPTLTKMKLKLPRSEERRV